MRINVGIRGDFTMGKINVDAQIAGELYQEYMLMRLGVVVSIVM